MRHKLQEGPKANISMMPSGSLTLRCCFLFHDQDTGGIPLNSKKELTGWELWVWSLCSAKQQVEGGTAWCCTYHVTKLTKGPTQTMQLLIPVRYLHLHRYQTGKKMLLLFQGRTYVGLSEGIGCHSVFLFQWTNAVFGEVIKSSILAGRPPFSWLGPPLHCSVAMFSLLLWSCLCCSVDRSPHVGATMLLCHCWPCPSHW